MIAVLEDPAIRKQAVPLTLQQYHTLVREGALPSGVEFIEGALIKKIPKSPLHEFIVMTILKALSARLPAGYILRKEGPLTTADSEPEPDISVVKGGARDFIYEHPRTALLVIEVSVTSQELDFAKADIYASANIPKYIVVDAQQRLVSTFDNVRNRKYETESRNPHFLEIPECSVHIPLRELIPDSRVG